MPQDAQALCLLIFVLGLKHGFDADHLATIDGLTRVNQRRGRAWARYCGTFFSLGHGAVVVLVAVVVGTLARRWAVPHWLDAFGAWTSIGMLAALGLVNIRAVLTTAPHEVARMVGFKGRFLGRLAQAGAPAWVALVGALFALSFDTLSQAALFALAASQMGGLQRALLVALMFVSGMLVTDGVNGLWIAHLICRADRLARIASRVMGLVVGVTSLLVAAFASARMGSTTLDAWSDGRELLFGAAVIAIVGIGFVAARMSAAAAARQ